MRKINILLFAILFLISFQNISLSQDLTPEQIYDKCNDAIVVIYAYNQSNIPIAQGSGIILSDKGLILTNYHIFSEADNLKIFHFDKEIDYTQVIGVDTAKDILVLSTNYNSNTILNIANLIDIKVGNKVYALGSPLGYENSLSDGIVAGLDRTFKEIGKTNLIQITAVINHGSSGGAVINSKGELIGISSYRKDDNLYFAIPIDEINKLKIVKVGDRSIEQYIYKIKAGVYTQKNDFSNAIYYYSKYISENKENNYVFIARGYCYLNSDDYEEAKKDFEFILSINNNSEPAHIGMGDYYFLKDNLEKSELEFKKVMLLNPQNYDAIYRRADIYLKIGSYDLALKEYNKALDLSPKNPEIIIRRSKAYFQNEQYDKAFSDINYILSFEPMNEKALYLKKQMTTLIIEKAKLDAITYKNIFNIISVFGTKFIPEIFK